jgi:hypothetical protein
LLQSQHVYLWPQVTSWLSPVVEQVVVAAAVVDLVAQVVPVALPVDPAG